MAFSLVYWISLFLLNHIVERRNIKKCKCHKHHHIPTTTIPTSPFTSTTTTTTNPSLCDATAYASVPVPIINGEASISSTCFTSLSLPGYTSNNWGWVSEIHYTDVSTINYVLDLYAGAAQCDYSKGTYIGKAYIYSETIGINTTLSIKYDVLPNFSMGEVHVYIGTEPLPKNPITGNYTDAPGQYTIVQSPCFK